MQDEGHSDTDTSSVLKYQQFSKTSALQDEKEV